MNSGMMPGWLRALPNGKPISALGFGCSSLWAKPSLPDGDARAILDALAADGVNCFDTAPLYGSGCGERRLGAFLSGKDLGQFVVSTKVGHNLIDGRLQRGFDIAMVDRSFRDSLKRLGIPRVDLLFLHGPEIADLNPAVFGWLDALKQADLIGYAGVNSFDNRVLEAVVRSPIDAVMLQLNVADFRNAAVLEQLRADGKMIFSGTAMARAAFDLSAFVPRNRASLWYLLRLLRKDPRAPLRVRRLRQVLTRFDHDPYAAAIRFMASHPHVLTSLFGTSRLAHAAANVRNAKRPMSSSEWHDLAAQLRAVNGSHG